MFSDGCHKLFLLHQHIIGIRLKHTFRHSFFRDLASCKWAAAQPTTLQKETPFFSVVTENTELWQLNHRLCSCENFLKYFFLHCTIFLYYSLIIFSLNGDCLWKIMRISDRILARRYVEFLNCVGNRQKGVSTIQIPRMMVINERLYIYNVIFEHFLMFISWKWFLRKKFNQLNHYYLATRIHFTMYSHTSPLENADYRKNKDYSISF